MLKIGNYNALIVARKVEFGAYLGSGEDEVLLPSKYMPQGTKIGDTLNVFIYTDSEDRRIATTRKPKAVVGEFAYLKVKDVTSFGAFMDWGLEKDLLVPKNQQQDRLRVGKKYVVKICLDDVTQRVYGTNRIAANCEKIPSGLVEGQKVRLLIYGLSNIGITAVINNQYTGMLYRNETYDELHVGDERDGYVSRIREDGSIDLTLKRPGYRSITDSSSKIIQILNQSGGFIPCHDKSPPDEIKKMFAMSKKEFKRAIGGLYKSRKIEILDNGIRLITKR